MTAMGKAGAFSMLAETAEEFIQLECARRRNQASLKRRSSLPSQFHVSGHKSRLKEKLAQARRHAFLLRADNKAALDSIIDNVRDLASNGEEGGYENKSSQRNSGPSPLERDRFISWAADVEKLLYEFEPSENHSDDPLLRILEHLQFLQDGHVCLAEVAMDARTLLERWDRSGVFDSESSSEDEDDDNDENSARIPDNLGFLPPDPAKQHLRHLEQSYAYQSVRQRAAASIIKRNVLAWVRSKASFCERVAEIEIFGRTTEALLKELSLTSAALAGANTNGNTDIFALATGRCDPKSRYSGSIAFKDLLQFSKHMALFPVDQALRTVEDVTRRRYLFDSRCAMKIQFVWRRVREVVRARRLHRAMEELRLQREREAQAMREAVKDVKKRKASETGKRKNTKTLKRSSTTRTSMISAAITKPNTAIENPKEPSKESIQPERQESPGDANDKRKLPSSPIDASSHRTSAHDSTTSFLNDKAKPPSPTSRNKPRQSRDAGANSPDSDDDTTDVEAAWKSFMDTVAADVAVQEPSSDSELTTTPEEEPASTSMPPVTLPPMEDNWESWSDDEPEVGDNDNLEIEDRNERRLNSARSSTPLASDVPTPRMKVVVSVNKSTLSDTTTAFSRLSRRETTAPRKNHSGPPASRSTSVIRPPSSLPFDATLHNHTGPYTGAGQLSLMAPFVDADRSKKSQPSVVPERKHLYDLDFNGAERKDATFAHIARAFASSREPETQQAASTPPRPKTPDKLKATPVETPRAGSRRTTIARLRSITGGHEQSARVRDLPNSDNQDSKDPQVGPNQKAPFEGSSSSKPGYFIYGAKGVNIQRMVVMRRGTMVYSPLSGAPEEEATNAVEPGGKEVKEWHRSAVAVGLQELATPHPPDRQFRQAHRRRLQGPRHQTFNNEPTYPLQTIENQNPVGRSPKRRAEKRSELPLLLRRTRAAARHRTIDRSDQLVDEAGEDNHSEAPTPDTNKQMWKRGGELPELALAQIRDRVGYKSRPTHQKRMSIIAGRAPPSTDLRSDDSTQLAHKERPDTVFTVEEGDEEEDEDDDATSQHSDNHKDDSQDERPETANADVDGDTAPVESPNDDDSNKSQELHEEFRRLHLASRERELTRRRSLLAQLQSEEDAVTAVDDTPRQPKDTSEIEQQRRMWRRKSQAARSVKAVGDVSDASPVTFHFGSSDEDSDSARRRRRMRVKTRVATVDPFADPSDDESDRDDDALSVELGAGMTQQERDAAFQKLLTQYLGLLQCAPAEVARRLQVE